MKSEKYFHVITFFALFSVLNLLSTFCHDVDKRLSWRSQTFAMMSTNVCRGVYRLLPWCTQTFPTSSQFFCHAYQILFSGI